MKLNQFAALAALAVLFASCTSGDEGIFASIEREQKIISLGGLSETATVTSMAEVGGAVNKYFATGGKALFSRSTDPNAKTWHKSTVGGNAAVSAVGAAGGRVFAVAEGVLFVSTDGSNWTKVDLASGDRAYDLVPARKGDGVTADALIVVAATAESDAVAYRSIYLIDAAGNLSAAIALSTSPLSAPVRAAAYDGTDYILLSETSLWRVSPSFVVSPIPVTGVSGHDFAGLIYLDGSESVNKHSGYYLSTLSNAGVGGGIYKATAIGEFTALKTAVKVLQKAVGFGGVVVLRRE